MQLNPNKDGQEVEASSDLRSILLPTLLRSHVWSLHICGQLGPQSTHCRQMCTMPGLLHKQQRRLLWSIVVAVRHLRLLWRQEGCSQGINWIWAQTRTLATSILPVCRCDILRGPLPCSAVCVSVWMSASAQELLWRENGIRQLYAKHADTRDYLHQLDKLPPHSQLQAGRGNERWRAVDCVTQPSNWATGALNCRWASSGTDKFRGKWQHLQHRSNRDDRWE